MNRLMVLLFVGLTSIALAQDKLDYKTEKLDNNIWRVRVARDGKWPESGLSKYGILQKFPSLETSKQLDFGPVSAKFSHKGKGFEVSFPLAHGEKVYGLGDVSRDNVQRRPGIYQIYVQNITTYIPIPMVWTTRGWGVFMNTTWRHVFDVGKSDPNALTISANEGEIDFYVFTAPDARGLIGAYTKITGKPSLLPIWGYGFTFVANQWIDQFSLLDEVADFRAHKIPCDVMGLEPGWMETFYDHTTRKRWNTERFSFPFWRPLGPVTFPGAMARVGMKLSLWTCCNYDLFRYEEECAAGKDTLKLTKAIEKRTTGGWVDDKIECGDAAKVMKTSAVSTRRVGCFSCDPSPHWYEEGERPWFEHYRQFVDQGVQAFKLDGAWQVTPWNGVPNRKWSNGMNDEEAHNLYPVILDKQMARGYERYTGKRAMVYSAGGYAGVQQYVATWAGDTGGTARELISVMNLGISGHPHQSCDMEVRHETAAGLHFGFLMPWSQQNNWDFWDLPWLNDDQKVETFRKYAQLRYRLAPYIYSTAAEAAQTGWPIVRSLSLIHPEVEQYSNCADTYYFGDNLLVGVFSDSVTLPAGRWYEWRTDDEFVGPATMPVKADWSWGGALYVKAGAIIPMWPQKQYLEKGWNEQVVCHVWPSAEGTFRLYEDDGCSVAYREGRGAWTELKLVKGSAPDKVRFLIGRRNGEYDGMPKTRNFKVVVHSRGEVKTIDLGAVGDSGSEIEL
jgi:alpha-glucosidase (family GH31 glycosyl hydrolase)